MRKSSKPRCGLTAAEFAALHVLQDGRCYLCAIALEPGRKTHVDHCHETGSIRGLACHHCNVGVGHFRNNPQLMRRVADRLADSEHYPAPRLGLTSRGHTRSQNV